MALQDDGECVLAWLSRLLQLGGDCALDVVDDLLGDLVEVPLHGFLGVVVLPVAVFQLAVSDGEGFTGGVAEGEVEGGRDEKANVNCPPVASSSRVTGVDGVDRNNIFLGRWCKAYRKLSVNLYQVWINANGYGNRSYHSAFWREALSVC